MDMTLRSGSASRLLAGIAALALLLTASPAVAGGGVSYLDVDFEGWSWAEVNDDECFEVDDAWFTDPDGTDDAFDDYGEIEIAVGDGDADCYGPESLIVIGTFTGAVAETAIAVNGEAVTFLGSDLVSELSASGQWYFFLDEPLARQTMTFTNPGDEPIEVRVVRAGEMGSDSDSVIEGSSLGLETGDPSEVDISDESWLVTSDGGPDGDNEDPVVLHLFGAPRIGVGYSAEWELDDVYQEYTFTVAPGATVSLVWFVWLFDWTVSDQASFDAAVASAVASGFTTLTPSLLAGLDPDAIGTILNWGSGNGNGNVGGPVPASVPAGEGGVPLGVALIVLLGAAGAALVGRRLVVTAG